MRDCPNVEMREQLPELLHGRLADDARASVERHVAECAECAAELELLRRARDAVPVPAVDVARIARAIPPYAAQRSAATRRGVSGAWLRVAAAVVLVAGAAALWQATRRDNAPSATMGAPPPGGVARVADSGNRVAARVRPITPVTQLSLGEPISDLSDGDLRALAETVNELDAVPGTDVESIEPSIIDIEGDS